MATIENLERRTLFSVMTLVGIQSDIATPPPAVREFHGKPLAHAPAVTASAFIAPGQVFGTIGTHHNLTYTVSNISGQKAVLSISGPGMGTVMQTNGVTDLYVTHTTGASTLHLTSKGAPFAFGDVTVQGALASLDARTAAINGNFSISGAMKQFNLAAGGVAGGAGSVFTLGGAGSVSLSVGDMESVTFDSSETIRALTAGDWQGGIISAPAINVLTVKGDLSANVFVHGAMRLSSAKIGSVSDDTWAIPGGIGALAVLGNLSAANIYAGANAGPDNILGTNDDVYGATTIRSFTVGGYALSIVVVAGAAPSPDGGTIQVAAVVLAKSVIGAITVKGIVSGDSRFLAATLPATATIAGVKVNTKTDRRFHV
jgi:hypothetical protein